MAVSENVIKTIEELKAMDLQTVPAETIKEKLQTLPLLVHTIVVPAGGFILRNRSEENFDCFWEESNISFHKYSANAKIGRANSDKSAIFYGMLNYDGNENLCQVYCYVESSKFDSEDKISEGIEFATMGKWRIIKPIQVIIIDQFRDFHSSNNTLQEFFELYKNFAKTYPHYEDDILYVADFIAYEFSKNVRNFDPHLYKISSSFAEMCYEMGHLGIIFPSVKNSGQGLIIALTPKTASDYLQLEKVFMAKLIKRKDQVARDPYLFCNEFQPDGKFKWKEAESLGKARIEQMLRGRITN